MIAQPPQDPVPTESNGNGRDGKGLFLPGNQFAKGNPIARRVQRLRAELVRAVTPADIRAIVAKMIEQAKAGDIVAAREVLDRTFGKALAHVEMETRGSGPAQVMVVFDKDWYGNDAHSLPAVAAVTPEADPAITGPEQDHCGRPALGQDGNGVAGNGGGART